MSVEETDSQNESVPEVKLVRYVVAALILRGEQVLICQRRPDQANRPVHVDRVAVGHEAVAQPPGHVVVDGLVFPDRPTTVKQDEE